MLLQIMLGIVALGTMQAIKPLNKENRNVTPNGNFTAVINVNLNDFDEIYRSATRAVVSYTYYDTNDTTPLDDDDSIVFENAEGSLSQNTWNWFYVNELAFYNVNSLIGTALTTSEDIGISKNNESQIAKLKQESLHTFTLELENDKTPLRNNIEMYQLITQKPLEDELLNGWFSFDNKYRYPYDSANDIYLNKTQYKDISSGYVAIRKIWETNDQDLFINWGFNTAMQNQRISNTELIWKDGSTTRRIETKNIWYFANVKTDLDNLFTNYNVYKVLQPEKFSKNVVNKNLYFRDYRPYARYSQEYKLGSILLKNYSGNTLPTISQAPLGNIEGGATGTFNGLFKIGNWTTNVISNNYVSYDNAYHYKLNNDHEIEFLNGIYSDVAYVNTTFQTPDLNQEVLAEAQLINGTYNNENVTAYTGTINLRYNEIYIAAAYNFSFNDFLVNFENITITTGDTYTDVFTLISNGFKSWTALFEMRIGPISVGTLFFVPLVYGFIIWLIHLVKRG